MNKKAYSLLVAEDDPNLGQLLVEYLGVQGYKADLFTDGIEAWSGLKSKNYDLCILDVMMPKEDGFTLARRIKTNTPDMPILFLSAKNQIDDRIEGLSIGADDYVTKPFSMRELSLRLTAILRRNDRTLGDLEVSAYHFGDSSLNVPARILTVNGKVGKLTNKEFELICVLLRNMNQTVKRSQVLKTVWGLDTFHNARSMDVYVNKLRKHLKADPKLQIVTVHGEGLRLVDLSSN